MAMLGNGVLFAYLMSVYCSCLGAVGIRGHVADIKSPVSPVH